VLSTSWRRPRRLPWLSVSSASRRSAGPTTKSRSLRSRDTKPQASNWAHRRCTVALGRPSAATSAASDIGRPLSARVDSRRRLRSAEEDEGAGASSEGGVEVSMAEGHEQTGRRCWRLRVGGQCRSAFGAHCHAGGVSHRLSNLSQLRRVNTNNETLRPIFNVTYTGRQAKTVFRDTESQ
jgi:hypothetical protein